MNVWIALSVFSLLTLPLGAIYAWLHFRACRSISGAGLKFACLTWLVEITAIVAFVCSGVWYSEHGDENRQPSSAEAHWPVLVFLATLVPWLGVAHTLTRQPSRRCR